MDHTAKINIIQSSIRESAESARLNAGYGGRSDDGGAYQSEQQLAAWLDGIQFASTSHTKIYGNIIKEYENKQDAEYQTYLRLKGKFEK